MEEDTLKEFGQYLAHANYHDVRVVQCDTTFYSVIPSPLTPEQAMKFYRQRLATFEHHEIGNYPQIYFFGHNAWKKHDVLVGSFHNDCPD